MADLIPGWFPPSRENWELINFYWQFFPLFSVVQYFTDYYPQGKTSIESRLNLPGKWAWFLMESPGFLTVLYCMSTIPAKLGLASGAGFAGFMAMPLGNNIMAGAFTFHYLYRAIASPLLLNPSMSPIHPAVFLSAFTWQVINGLCIGGWVAGYGPTTKSDWAGTVYNVMFGLVIWSWALLGNMYHEEELREIRREAAREQAKKAEEAKAKGGKSEPPKSVAKIYKIPKNGLFDYVFYAHFFCEWIEWAGFWLIGGSNCMPARSFFINEVSTMLPRALSGRRWYIEKFGQKAVGDRKAVIPFVV